MILKKFRIQLGAEVFLFVFLLTNISTFAQADDPDCKPHPLFSNFPNSYTMHGGCSSMDFGELDIFENDEYVKKSGEFLSVRYQIYPNAKGKFPSNTELFTNFINAVKKAGGEVVRENIGSSFVHFKLKKGNDIYWIVVRGSSGDGQIISAYEIKSVRESLMNQSVVVTAEEIKKDIFSAGKSIIYGIYFDTGKSEIKPESDPTLDQITKFLKDNSNIKVFIVGHTDSDGKFESNMKLSKDRANAVVNLLVTKYGINKNRLQADGVGQLCPISTNSTDEGKKFNRRVEVVLQ
ncbi:MAG: OmpA family protein [Ignavibacteriales bacterium]|nr:OmpA family protein [Ignavibacteriales bacterium]